MFFYLSSVNFRGRPMNLSFGEVQQGLFACKGCRFIFNLIGDTVNRDVPVLGEWNGIFDPFLTERLGDELLENLALVVLAFLDHMVEEVGGAKALSELEHIDLLVDCRLEAEREASATARLVELEHSLDLASIHMSHIDEATETEAHNVAMGEAHGVVGVEHLFEECCVHHFLVSPFLYCTYSIAYPGPPVNELFMNILLTIYELYFQTIV